jgi:hypothetical protein
MARREWAKAMNSWKAVWEREARRKVPTRAKIVEITFKLHPVTFVPRRLPIIGRQPSSLETVTERKFQLQVLIKQTLGRIKHRDKAKVVAAWLEFSAVYGKEKGTVAKYRKVRRWARTSRCTFTIHWIIAYSP